MLVVFFVQTIGGGAKIKPRDHVFFILLFCFQGYIVYITEPGKGSERQSQPYLSTTQPFLNITFKNLTAGATYIFRVKNSNSKSSRISEAVNITLR